MLVLNFGIKIGGGMVKLKGLLVAVGMVFLSSNVLASQVVFEEVGYVNKDYISINKFQIDDPGIYQISIVDFALPGEIDDIVVNIVQGASKEITRWEDIGTFTFEVLDAGSYFANVFGGMNESESDTGLFGLTISQVDVAPVPLPAGLVLLISALGVFFGTAVRRSTVDQPQIHNVIITA